MTQAVQQGDAQASITEPLNIDTIESGSNLASIAIGMS